MAGRQIPLPKVFTYLHYHRLQFGLSRAAVVKRINDKSVLTETRLWNIEYGIDPPTDEQLEALSRVLRITPTSILMRPVKVTLPEVEDAPAEATA